MNICKLTTALLVLGAAAAPTFAEPMMAPTMKEAAKSPIIFVAQYDGYKPFLEPVTYFDGVMAHFTLTRVLKGPELLNPHINVAYAFHDGSACEAEKGWKFSEAKMPAKGSSWILFLEEPKFKSSNSNNAYTTYRGDFGRMPATTSNIESVQKLISK
ncbi:MAG: hypothetical protein HYX67_08260 [Candidatus Melainabacteria bacterium]|nr:hypothetical protein [Candidatus Melainabacteria bacterium]